MKILVVRTDNPQAEVAVYDGQTMLQRVSWQAHTELTKTINNKIKEILDLLSISLHEINGLVFYNEKGSFTGLRIGVSVVNTLAYSLNVPVVGASGKSWIRRGIDELEAGKDQKIITPLYGSPAKTTPPRK